MKLRRRARSQENRENTLHSVGIIHQQRELIAFSGEATWYSSKSSYKLYSLYGCPDQKRFQLLSSLLIVFVLMAFASFAYGIAPTSSAHPLWRR